jgi:MFS transporter, ACS family, hexuronate transporter
MAKAGRSVEHSGSTEPTRLGLWAPTLAMMLLSFLSYADRSVLAILSPTILADLHMSATQYGWAILTFSLCYMIANPIWGYWIDRVGLFVMVAVAVGLWSVLSGAHALVTGLGGLCVARGLLGFGEGATFPAALSTVAATLPVGKRSFGIGLAFSGGSLGAALTPLLVTPIALRFGWRAAFAVTMLAGLVWIGLWISLRKHLGAARGSEPAARVEPKPQTPYWRHWWNRGLLATAAAYGLGAAPLAFGLYAAPLYLARVLHVSQASLGHLLWVPPLGWEAGYLFWGRVSDARRVRGATSPLAFFGTLCVAGFCIVLAPLAAKTAHGVVLTMLLFFVEMFIAGGFVVLSLADGMERQPGQNPGFLAGFSISAWALSTGLLMPVLGRLFDLGRYDAGFWLVACLPVAGTLLWGLFAGDMQRPKASSA